MSKRTAAVVTNQTVPASKDQKDADIYESRIVHMNDDPYRERSIAKRRYEEQHPETVDWEARRPHRSGTEFGGPIGCAAIILFAHAIVIYFCLCLQTNQGELILPTSLSDLITGSYFSRIASLTITHASPSIKSCAWYWTFLLIQGIFYLTLPGITRLGEPLPALKGKKLTYYCNSYFTFFFTFVCFGFAHYFDIFDYTQIIDEVAPLGTTAMLTADLISLAIYYNTFGTGVADKDISGNFVYDVLMGVVLNPRIGMLDIKMFFEIRMSWIMMTIITTSAALKYYVEHGYLSNNMIIITTGITIYSYSTSKGEHLVLPTWDITTERYGLFLCGWNSALPFIYSAQSVFILMRDRINPEEIAISDPWFYLMMTILLLAYYGFDTVNSQKSAFRQQYNGTFEPRFVIPTFSYGTLENPKYLRTKAGTPLLLSGWYSWARKWQYTTDTVMASIWCLSCGINGYFIPKFYIIFFVSMLIHRCLRDEEKCAKKYGADWVTYCQHVPYRFIPYVY